MRFVTLMFGCEDYYRSFGAMAVWFVLLLWFRFFFFSFNIPRILISIVLWGFRLHIEE
jgi:hypothetical protein